MTKIAFVLLVAVFVPGSACANSTMTTHSVAVHFSEPMPTNQKSFDEFIPFFNPNEYSTDLAINNLNFPKEIPIHFSCFCGGTTF